MYDVAEAFTTLARARGFNPAALAVAWVAHHPAVTAPIIGARNIEQLKGSLQALQIPMTDELYQAICALTPPPPSPTGHDHEDK
jgi:aryl-alcohol dehydrogenase-like predicted oxidoreductase